MNEYIKEILIEHNIRPSIQRIIIYEYMYDNKEHPTVDTIFNALYKKIPTLSKATIYNTLKLFEQHNLVQTLNIEDNETRYDAYIKPHIHFKCIKCGKIIDIDYSTDVMELNDFQGNKIIYKKFYLLGICKECLKNNKN